MRLFWFVSYAASSALAGGPLPRRQRRVTRSVASWRRGLGWWVCQRAMTASVRAPRVSCRVCHLQPVRRLPDDGVATGGGRAVARVTATVRVRGAVGGVATELLQGVVFSAKAAPPSTPPAVTAVSDREATSGYVSRVFVFWVGGVESGKKGEGGAGRRAGSKVKMDPSLPRLTA